MTRCVSQLWLLLLLPAAGCFADGPQKLVSANPFGNTPPKGTPARVMYAPASEETGKRVGQVGEKLLAANRQTIIHPVFQTVGSSQPEVFHHDTSAVYITEGMVRECKSDGQLAAVLALELGKMVSEREALARPASRMPDRWVPMEVRVGNDVGGAFGAADGTHLAELAKANRLRDGAANVQPPAPPSPEVLARCYLCKAGYAADDLSEVTPLLKKAEGNFALEKQLKAAVVGRPN
ncbi:MAG TPA: hypothetical protein VFE78_19085 [Gemmataceae bacterium]|jgi:hypothetical protein|nr:hypothetical protein [Gemmataceae bacterium]